MIDCRNPFSVSPVVRLNAVLERPYLFSRQKPSEAQPIVSKVQGLSSESYNSTLSALRYSPLFQHHSTHRSLPASAKIVSLSSLGSPSTVLWPVNNSRKKYSDTELPNNTTEQQSTPSLTAASARTSISRLGQAPRTHTPPQPWQTHQQHSPEALTPNQRRSPSSSAICY